MGVPHQNMGVVIIMNALINIHNFSLPLLGHRICLLLPDSFWNFDVLALLSIDIQNQREIWFEAFCSEYAADKGLQKSLQNKKIIEINVATIKLIMQKQITIQKISYISKSKE